MFKVPIVLFLEHKLRRERVSTNARDHRGGANTERAVNNVHACVQASNDKSQWPGVTGN